MLKCLYPRDRSEQLPCTHVMAFSPISLFLEQCLREVKISLKCHKLVSKTYRPQNVIFDLLFLSFDSLIDGAELTFSSGEVL